MGSRWIRDKWNNCLINPSINWRMKTFQFEVYKVIVWKSGKICSVASTF